MDELPIQRIKDLIQQDDPAALTLIYDVMGQRLYRYVLGLVGSEAEAEDVIQDLFVRLAHKRRQLLDVEKMEAYLYAMVRNLVRDALNRRPRDTIPIEEYQEVLIDTAAPSEPREGGTEVLQALLALPLKQREIVTMKCLDAMTFDEIARSLSISINTAASRYRYALDKLRHRLRRFQHE